MNTMRDAKMHYDNGPTASGEPDGYYQSLEFEAKQLPELSTWLPGEEYILVIKVRETKHAVTKEDGKTKECATFEVIEVSAQMVSHRDIAKLQKNYLNKEWLI